VRLVLGWALAFGVGVAAGRWAVEWVRAPMDAPVASPRAPSPGPPPSQYVPALATGTSEAEIASTETASPGMGRHGDRLAEQNDPIEILDAVIDSLRDDEIIAALSTATQMDPEELRDVRDPRAMAQRMSAIAMEDLIDTGRVESDDLARVRFSKDGPRDSNDSQGDSAPQAPGEGGPSRFSGKDSIRATFSTADYADRRVFMKWSRVDEPEVVLFRPYPVTPGARTSEVALRHRSKLPPGRYKVAFYSGDETMRPLASGRYTVVSPGEDAD
jgi:hypothetical protein